MKNTPKLFKVFLDTSSLLSGLNSTFGASGLIISLFKLRKIIIIISPEVILEAGEVIRNKFPLLKTPFLDFLADRPVNTGKVTTSELRTAYNIIHSEDSPILAGAMKANADFLVTLDKKFQKLVRDKTSISVLSPGEFLQRFRAQEKVW